MKRCLLLMLVINASCVKDDTSISDTNEFASYDQSIHLVAILNDFSKNISQQIETAQCFDFKYPIKLQYNTEATIELKSYSGLRTAITNQTDNFNLVGLVFPVEIVFSGTLTTQTITSENEFLEVLNLCRIRSFGTEFNEFYNRCFQLEFPLSLIKSSNQSISILTSQGFDTYLKNQQANFQPIFEFPITLIDKETQTKKTVSTYYEIYQSINACPDIFELCPAYDFSVTLNSALDLNYSFERVNSAALEFSPYDWSVNGIAVKTDGGPSGTNTLDYNFSQPGFYTICINSQEECLGETQFCKEIIVPEYCAPLSFISTQVPNSLEFNFTADFIDRDILQYNWFIDGVLVEANDGGTAGDNLLNYTFVPGSYTLCIEAISSSCLQGMQYCKEIEVLPICLQLAFTYEKLLLLPLYSFTADFPEKNDVTYSWYIDNVFIEEDGGGVGGDNVMQYNLLVGVYEVCIRYQSPECPEGVQFCQIVTVL